MEKKIVVRNIITSLMLQLVIIISGFVIPKVTLNYFGSEVNGLISSINQFLNYIQLLEGGLSGVIMAALYKPLSDADEKKINGVVNAASTFYKKIGEIYIIYIAIIAIVYPHIVKTKYTTAYVSALVVVLGMNLFVQYFFSLTYRLLLNADRKVYFVSLTQIVILLINMISVVICAHIFKNILAIRFFSALIFIIQPILYTSYVKHHYHLDKKIPPDNTAIKQRWDGFGINLAYFIHTNTDVVVLTILSTLAYVSVYAVYLMIINALKSLVMSISSAVSPSMGKIFVEDDRQKLNTAFDKYVFIINFVTALLFSCGIMLITPFVGIYTEGIKDANYHQYEFGVILSLAEMVCCVRDPYITICYNAGKFKDISKYAYIEAALNIIISLAAVKKYGLVGVAVGTLLSMIYRLFVHVVYLKHNILFRPISKFLKSTVAFGSVTLVSTILSYFFDVHCKSYLTWISLGMKSFIIVLVLDLSVSLLLYRNILKASYSFWERIVHK